MSRCVQPDTSARLAMSVKTYVDLLREAGDHATADRVLRQAGPRDVIAIAQGEAVLVDFAEVEH